MGSRDILFGGTFDPVHNAHLEIARAAADRFSPARIVFVPAANPPHKLRGAQASYEDRVRMTELACAEDLRFCVSRIEEGSVRSYSVDTIERLAAAGAKPWAFLIGADAFAEIESWHRWRDVVRLVDFIVVARPGSAYRVPEGATVHELPKLNLGISSSEVRRKLAAGEIDHALPAPVAGYIQLHNLYRDVRPNN